MTLNEHYNRYVDTTMYLLITAISKEDVEEFIGILNSFYSLALYIVENKPNHKRWLFTQLDKAMEDLVEVLRDVNKLVKLSNLSNHKLFCVREALFMLKDLLRLANETELQFVKEVIDTYENIVIELLIEYPGQEMFTKLEKAKEDLENVGSKKIVKEENMKKKDKVKKKDLVTDLTGLFKN